MNERDECPSECREDGVSTVLKWFDASHPEIDE